MATLADKMSVDFTTIPAATRGNKAGPTDFTPVCSTVDFQAKTVVKCGDATTHSYSDVHVGFPNHLPMPTPSSIASLPTLRQNEIDSSSIATLPTLRQNEIDSTRARIEIEQEPRYNTIPDEKPNQASAFSAQNLSDLNREMQQQQQEKEEKEAKEKKEEKEKQFRNLPYIALPVTTLAFADSALLAGESTILHYRSLPEDV